MNRTILTDGQLIWGIRLIELDTRGLLCPLPVLKLRKAIQNISQNEKIKLLTDGTQEYCEGRLEFAIEVLKIAVDLDMDLHFEEADE